MIGSKNRFLSRYHTELDKAASGHRHTYRVIKILKSTKIQHVLKILINQMLKYQLKVVFQSNCFIRSFRLTS